MLFETIIQIIFGWPAIITTILLSITGLVLKKPLLPIIAGFLCIPFTYYASNGFQNPLVTLPLLQFASAFAIKRHKQVIAWVLIMPLVFVSVTLAYAVLTQ
jgi:hypothetical protein